MKNNKIIENRPELTSEQITQGMDFSKVVNSVALAKAVLLKSIIVKGIIGIISVSSFIAVYEVYMHSLPESKQLLQIDTTKNISPTQEKPPVIHSNKTNDSIPLPVTKKITIPKTQQPLTPLQTEPILPNTVLLDSLNLKTDSNTVKTNTSLKDTLQKNDESVNRENKSKSSYKLNRFAKCKLWKTKSYCDIPRKANLSGRFDVDATEYDFVSCEQASADMQNMKAVWITVDVKGTTKLRLESQLKNITLIESKNGKSMHPLMVAVGKDGSSFFGKNFRAKKFVANFYGRFDIFLFFPEAEVGDTILIKNFLESVITE